MGLNQLYYNSSNWHFTQAESKTKTCEFYKMENYNNDTESIYIY